MKKYKTFMLSEEPKLFGIAMTTAIPVFLFTAIGLITGYATQCFALGSLISLVMHFSFGGLPIKFFYAILYWHLPKSVTGQIFSGSPDSANRVYVG